MSQSWGEPCLTLDLSRVHEQTHSHLHACARLTVQLTQREHTSAGVISPGGSLAVNICLSHLVLLQLPTWLT